MGGWKIEYSNSSPSKLLHDVCPIPKLNIIFHKRGKQSATVLNELENIDKKKSMARQKIKRIFYQKGKAIQKILKKYIKNKNWTTGKLEQY